MSLAALLPAITPGKGGGVTAPATRVFTVSPAIGGQSTIDLSSADLVAALTNGSPNTDWTLTAQSNFTFSAVLWGEGTFGNAKGGYVSGQLAVTTGQVLKIRLVGGGRGQQSGGGGYAGIFLTSGAPSQANAKFIAAGAGGPRRDSSGNQINEAAAAGGAETGQTGQQGSNPGAGGSQSAGGAKGNESHGESSGATPGGALSPGGGGYPTDDGANGWFRGGDGGSGYFGGGGGSAGGSLSGSGGGGSNFLAGDVVSPVSERGGGRSNSRRGTGGDNYSCRVVLF